MEDLWPDKIETVKLKAPVNILKEQALLLGKKTSNIVEGEVISISGSYWMREDDFAYTFILVGTTLNYKYELFSIAHGIIMYPLSINCTTEIREAIKKEITDAENDTSAIHIKSEKDFLKALKIIFNSNKTVQVVQTILAQSS